MNERSTSLQRVKRIAGGNAGLGRLLGISPQAVSQWRQVPAERVVDVERVTGVSREELRPDIFQPPADAKPATHDRGVSGNGGDGNAPVGRDGQFSRFSHLRRAHFKSTEEIVEHVRALREEWDRR